jgi:hypothetical protein
MPYSAVTHPFAAALEKRGRLFLEARRYEHMGMAELHQAGAFCMFGDAGFEAYATQLIVGAFGWAHVLNFVDCEAT